ncbi:deoxyuridine 5'-triphosphate nucleotidohydrolase [Synergistales bacterium]|nr:deoxyuridine 5'-triphosphate nucleotidohydrolase [Synergistales bacterium]
MAADNPIVKVRPGESGLTLPSYATAGAAGMDLRASEDAAIEAGSFKAVPTGIYIEIPDGFEGQVRPRSGLAAKYGVTVLNSPGTIDSDYRGEIKVLLINHGAKPFIARRGDRIAQIIFAPVTRARIEAVPELSVTERGANGFGSTGVM